MKKITSVMTDFSPIIDLHYLYTYNTELISVEKTLLK